VGIDLGTPVVEAVGSEEKSRFTGKIPKVTVEIRNVNPRAEAKVKKAWAEVRQKTD
jgi:arylsulfatase